MVDLLNWQAAIIFATGILSPTLQTGAGYASIFGAAPALTV
jgi:hypothetical protein